MRGLMRGGDIKRATSLPGFPKLARKAQMMRKQIEAKKKERDG